MIHVFTTLLGVSVIFKYSLTLNRFYAQIIMYILKISILFQRLTICFFLFNAIISIGVKVTNTSTVVTLLVLVLTLIDLQNST
jgi:hypothetical protein